MNTGSDFTKIKIEAVWLWVWKSLQLGQICGQGKKQAFSLIDIWGLFFLYSEVR
jgi:hypothetical protein